MQLPPPTVFHDKAKRTQQGNLLDGGAGGDTCTGNGDNVGDIGGHLGKDGHVR